MDATTQTILADMIKERELEAWECCVVGDGVFFVKERPASIYADRHNKIVVRIETDRLQGWLAQNPRVT